ncbi:MAG TPA: HAD hydrolase-like protein [Thermotogota bacterium]|nr:HAD hydrolase-like protein [Thermotogota bacterium]HPJ89498.1 HAD hydrolase-like protein [Thermotogota bacterium]HPR96390.1 HAD hydrolase-like protein [Thermotogota bacterium]
MIKYVLWDFNGTLINDVDAAVQNINDLLRKYGKKQIDLETYREVFTFPVIEYYKNVGLVKDDEEFKGIAHEWMDGYYAMEKDLKIFGGTYRNLERVHELGLRQGVLSASSMKQLTRLLDQHELTGYMDDILGVDDIYANGKVEVGLNFIRNHHLNPEEVVLIGDTFHDYEVAAEMGIHCILSAKGHQSHEILSSTGCLVVQEIEEIFDSELFQSID